MSSKTFSPQRIPTHLVPVWKAVSKLREPHKRGPGLHIDSNSNNTTRVTGSTSAGVDEAKNWKSIGNTVEMEREIET